MTSAVPQKQFTGRHMLASIVAFFAVIIGVNLVMAYLANSTWSGLIVKNGYVASQSFGKDLAIAKSQEARGWTVVLSHDGNQVKLNFSDRISQKLSRLTVTGQLRRPTTDKLDQKLTFTPAGAGTSTSCEKPSCRLSEVPFIAAR